MNIRRILFFSLLITALEYPTTLEAKDTFCTGSLTGSFDNLTVPSGASCTLSGVQISGNIRVAQDAVLTVTGPGFTVITGDVQADHCQSVLLKGSVAIQGNVEIQHCTATSGYIGPGIQIRGDFECHNNASSCVADQGAVGGNIHVHNNSSLTASDIGLNTIGRNLQCEQNDTPPTHILGANKIAGSALGQCGVDSGFSLQTTPSTTSQIGPEGGTVITPQGDQLIVATGALAAVATVSLRTVSRDEVAVALESNVFDGQKLTLVGTADLETTSPSFSIPVKLAFPNSSGVPQNAQVLVMKISSDVTGDGIPDLILVDTASVVDQQIQDGNVALSGIITPGIYAMFQVNSSLPPGSTNGGTPYNFIQGNVANLTAPPAFVWNSAAPDFIVQSDSVGNFVTLAPPSSASALFIAADQSPKFGVANVVLPGPAQVPLKFALPQACQVAFSDPGLCKENSTEDAINKLKDQLQDRLEDLFDPDQVQLSVTPTTIAQGGKATAVLDVQSFLADEISKDFPISLQSKISLRNPYCPSLQMEAVVGLAKAQFSLATSTIASDNTSVASVSPIVSPSFGANPTATITGVKADPTPANISAALIGMSFTAQAQIEMTKPDGSQCSPISQGIDPDLKALTVGSNSVPVTVTGAATIQVVSASYGSGNCGTPVGNVTGPVASMCNGQVDCNVFVDNSVFGDPAVGCPKDFTARWLCGTQSRTASHGPVVNEGYTVLLSCR